MTEALHSPPRISLVYHQMRLRKLVQLKLMKVVQLVLSLLPTTSETVMHQHYASTTPGYQTLHGLMSMALAR